MTETDTARLFGYLTHILQAIDRIQNYTEELDEVAFLQNEMAQYFRIHPASLLPLPPVDDESDSNGGVIRRPEIVGFPRQSLDTSGQMPHQDGHRTAQHGPTWSYMLSNEINHIAYTPPLESLSDLAVKNWMKC